MSYRLRGLVPFGSSVPSTRGVSGVPPFTGNGTLVEFPWSSVCRPVGTLDLSLSGRSIDGMNT